MSDAEDTYGYAYRSGHRTYDWIEVRGIEHTWMVELGRARELAVRLEGRAAELEAALSDALRLHHYERECHCPECDRIRAALAGTGDEVGAVVRAAVRYWQQAGQTDGQAERYNALVTLMDKVADLLAKQPGVWEVRR